VVVAPLAVGSRLCGALRQVRISARLVACDAPPSAVVEGPGGVVLLDVGCGGPAASRVRALLDVDPTLRVVVLGRDEPGHDLLESLLAGAAGYLPNDLDLEALARSIRGVADGEVALPRAWVGRVVAALRLATGAGVVLPAPAC
jgi:DNA-binding NarL/FixJ family response regulator